MQPKRGIRYNKKSPRKPIKESVETKKEAGDDKSSETHPTAESSKDSGSNAVKRIDLVAMCSIIK